MMAWYTPAPITDSISKRISNLTSNLFNRHDNDEVGIATVAYDGFLELRAYEDRWNTSYYAHDPNHPKDDVFVQRGGTLKSAISEFRRMIREGEI